LILASLNMPLASGRQVNEKPLKIGINSQKSARFDPLSWEKTRKRVASFHGMPLSETYTKVS
jgi:hypothetical protein